MKILNKKSLGILISFAFIWFIFSQIDINKTINSFRLMNFSYILPILPVYLMGFVIRAFRWRVFLCNDSLKFSSLISSIFVGFSMNCILPARAGEIYRAYFFSKKENLGTTKVFTSVILERVFDGLTLFLILFGTIYLLHPGNLFFKIAVFAGLIFLSGFIFLLILVYFQNSGDKRKKIQQFLLNLTKNSPRKMQLSIQKIIKKIFSILNSFIEALKSLKSWQTLVKSGFYSLLIWLIEGSFVYLVIKSFGVDVSLLGGLFVLAVIAFSTLIPAGPAGVGPYQWGYIVAIGVFGVSQELGLAISLINHALSIFIILTIGLLFIWKDHINLNDVKQNLEEAQEVPS